MCAILFLGFALAVHARLLVGLDEAGLGFIAAARPKSLSDAANWIFRLGYVQVDLAVGVAWTALALICRRPLPVALVPLVLLVVVGAQAALRLAIDQPGPESQYALRRPSLAHPAGYVLDQVDAASRGAFVNATTAGVPTNRAQGSFPSGHAARSLLLAFLATTEVRQRNRFSGMGSYLLVAVLIGFGILVGLSALYFGYHWPSDVVGGWLLAVAAYRATAWLRGLAPA